MYKPKQLESAFIEIYNESKKNIIIGCIYRHLWTYVNSIMTFFNPFMEKIASEDRKLFLTGDFNIDHLKVDMDTPTMNFLDTHQTY